MRIIHNFSARTCADHESFVRGGLTLTTFFSVEEGDLNIILMHMQMQRDV